MSKSKSAADNGLSTGHESEFQIFVVLCIAAVGHAHDRIKPYGRALRRISKKRWRRRSVIACEFRAGEPRRSLSVGPAESANTSTSSARNSAALRYAIRLERYAYESRGI